MTDTTRAVQLRAENLVMGVAQRRAGVVTNISSTFAQQVGVICCNVDVTLLCAGLKWVLVPGMPFSTARVGRVGDIVFHGMQVDDREHGMLLLHTGFTP